MNQLFNEWLQALEARHLADLTFSEVSRALRALSSAYVERRGGLREGQALTGAGKRAAFALFYGPLHYLLIERIAVALDAAERPVTTIVDLGCGTGAAGAALARTFSNPPNIVGIDRHPWPLKEAAQTYRHFGLKARTVLGDLADRRWPDARTLFVASFALNELDEESRASVLARLLDRADRRNPLLVVEPLARSVAPWWRRWQEAFARAGGRSDEWRFPVDLPPLVARLDRATGLDHSELTGRSLYVC